MAKVSANGCVEIGRCTKDEWDGETLVKRRYVLRSDGCLLVGTGWKYRTATRGGSCMGHDTGLKRSKVRIQKKEWTKWFEHMQTRGYKVSLNTTLDFA